MSHIEKNRLSVTAHIHIHAIGVRKLRIYYYTLIRVHEHDFTHMFIDLLNTYLTLSHYVTGWRLSWAQNLLSMRHLQDDPLFWSVASRIRINSVGYEVTQKSFCVCYEVFIFP